MYRPPLPLGKIGETPSPIFPEGTGGLYTGYHFPIGQYSNVPLKRIWFSGSWASNRLNIFRVKKEIACLKRGSELTDFCLKHAQGLKASATHPHLNFHWVSPLDWISLVEILKEEQGWSLGGNALCGESLLLIILLAPWGLSNTRQEGSGPLFFSSKSPGWVTEEFTISVFTIWGE